MGNRRRARPLREVKELTLARTIELDDPEITADVSVLLSGISSLLHIGFHLAFFPEGGKRPADADFAGNTFAIFGWTADERGHRVQLASAAITGDTLVPAPDGWAGRTELDQLELRATLTALGTVGEWKAIVVLEPGDAAMCEDLFRSLVSEVELGPVKKAVVVESS